MAVLLIVSFLVLIAAILLSEQDDRYKKKQALEREIERTKERVTDEFNSLTICLSEQTIEWLNKCAEKIRKMSTDPEVTNNLKPYDEFALEKPKKYSSDSFKIKVDKNLVPKFAPDDYHFFREEDKIDYELEACMDLKELEGFIAECKRILMDKNIEKHRKRQIEERIK